MTTLPNDNLELIKRIRGSSYLSVRPRTIVVSNDLDEETCNIKLCLHNGALIEASGVGMVDAIFSGLKTHYHDEFESLKDLELTNFFVKATTKGTNAEVEVTVEVKNSYGKYFSFQDNSKSMVASVTKVSAATIEYFCNSEAAFFSVLNALKDAKERHREDLVTRYTEELSLLVKNTCYTGLLEKESLGLIHETGGSEE